MISLTPATEDVITRHKRRRWCRQAPESYVDGLTAAGYHPTPITVEFLDRFGGLRFAQARSWWQVLFAPHEIFRFHFDPVKVIEEVRPEILEAFAERAGEQLCPIGELVTNQEYLFLAESGKVFAAFDVDTLREFAPDPATAVEKLLGTAAE